MPHAIDCSWSDGICTCGNEARRLRADLADCKDDYLRRHKEAADHFEVIIRLRAALAKAFALCRGCDGTGTVVIADVETGEQVGAQNCEKCWPIRINAGLEMSDSAPPGEVTV